MPATFDLTMFKVWFQWSSKVRTNGRKDDWLVVHNDCSKEVVDPVYLSLR
jgi:hypothetical protein